MTSREKRILLVTCFGHFMSHFNMLTFPAVVLPLAGRLGMTMSDVLGLSFPMYLLFGLTALPWGLAADRFGARPFLLLFYAGAGVSGLMIAWQIDSPLGLTLGLAALGLFSGIYHPIGLGMISREVRNIGPAMGYNGMFGNLGLGLAPFLAGLATWLSGPRTVYLALGALNLFGAVFMLMLAKSESSSREEGPEPVKRESHDTRTTRAAAFLILLVAMMLGGIIYRGATVITPAYFELKTRAVYLWLTSLFGSGLSANLAATTLTSAIFLVGMLGQYSGGKAAARFDLRRSYLAFHSVVLPAALLMAFVRDLPLAATALVFFFFLLGMQPVENTLVAKLTPARFRHSAYGMKFILTFGVGALSVKLVQAIKTAHGIEQVFLVLGGVSCALVATILVLIFVTRGTSPTGC